MGSDAHPGVLVRLPLFLLLTGIASVSMYLPAAHGFVVGNGAVATAFFYSGTLGLIVVTLVALALLGARRPRYGSLGQLGSLLATFALLPLFLALPLHEALGNTKYQNAYFDMVSAITTTGANIFHDPSRLDSTMHLWRAQVGWMGGFLMWVAASAILAPLSLGGFEVTARGQPGRPDAAPTRMLEGDPRRRLVRVTTTLLPIYAGLTGAAWVLQMMAGEGSLVALCHAMSVMATSGISPVGGMGGTQTGVAGEMILFLFMFFALSRLTFSTDTVTSGQGRLDRDPEFRIGLLLMLGIPILLFLRHWVAAFDVNSTGNPMLALRAFWGSMFTVLSFLTTTGFESTDWLEARQWSGLSTPGLILMGLALMGGGVATTAGGVKLLRVYALYLNGRRDMERLIHPSSVSGQKAANRRIQKDGAFIAWIFFMLFGLSLAVISVVLAALGSSYEEAMILTVATLSTTGPLIEVVGDSPIRLVELGGEAKGVLCLAMVLGRIETLAFIALLTPDLWRR